MISPRTIRWALLCAAGSLTVAGGVWATTVADGDWNVALSTWQQDEARLVKEVEGGSAARRALDLRITLQGRALTRAARAGLRPLAGGIDDFFQHAGRMERLREGLRRDLSQRQRVNERVLAAEKALAEVRGRRNALAVDDVELSTARAAILAARDREDAFQRAFASGPARAALYAPEAVPGEDTARRGFEALRGRLPLPVGGRVETMIGRRGATAWLELAAPDGATVRAIAPGRVSLVDVRDGLATVVLDHGDGFFSITSGLSSGAPKLGDDLPSGAPLGTCAERRVVVELRRGQLTLNPSEWFGV